MSGAGGVEPDTHPGDLHFRFVLAGGATFVRDGEGDEPIVRGAAFCIPAGLRYALRDVSHDLELFEVYAPHVPHGSA